MTHASRVVAALLEELVQQPTYPSNRTGWTVPFIECSAKRLETLLTAQIEQVEREAYAKGYQDGKDLDSKRNRASSLPLSTKLSEQQFHKGDRSY